MYALRLWLMCLIVTFMSAPAWAVSTDVKEQEYSSSRIFWAVTDGVGDHLGLHLTMEGKWKTYWRDPGDAGVPPKFTVKEESENVKSLELQYPTPKRYVDPTGLESIGYSEQVVYPLLLTREDVSKPVKLAVKLDYMVCERTCIPYSEDMVLEIGEGVTPASVDEELFGQYYRKLAAKQGDWVTIGEPLHYSDGTASWVEIDVKSQMPLTAIDLFVEGPDGFSFPKPTLTYHTDGHSATLRFDYVKFFEKDSLLGQNVTLTFTNAYRSAEYATKVQAAAQQPVQDGAAKTEGAAGRGSQDVTLELLLLFAFIGGLILNVMPCVLPVLSLKILSVLKHAGKGDAQHVRVAFSMSALGVITSFMLLAVLVILLKQAGVSVGWGLHFQQPIFLAVMAVIMVLFSSNLLDHFHLNLPGLLSDKINRSLDEAEKKHQLAGHFLTGAFATLLATPCTAPFLGTAVGLALTGSAQMILMTFFAMGVGLATPYILVSIMPAAVALLPKPGPWLITLRRIFVVFLLATVAWLLWVLSNQIGIYLAGLAAVCLIGLMLLFKRAAKGQVEHNILPSALMMIVLVIAVAIYGQRQAPAVTEKAAESAESVWKAFDEQSIAMLVAEGKTVFVDVTADWCLTCKVNKIAVMDRAAIKEQLAQKHVVAMRADWTNYDENISAYLAKYQRAGIPFNIVYGPAAPEGVVLNELLTIGAVEEALKKASGK